MTPELQNLGHRKFPPGNLSFVWPPCHDSVTFIQLSREKAGVFPRGESLDCGDSAGAIARKRDRRLADRRRRLALATCDGMSVDLGSPLAAAVTPNPDPAHCSPWDPPWGRTLAGGRKPSAFFSFLFRHRDQPRSTACGGRALRGGVSNLE